MLPVAVTPFFNDGVAIFTYTSGFVDDVMFLHNGLYGVSCVPKQREHNSRNYYIDSPKKFA